MGEGAGVSLHPRAEGSGEAVAARRAAVAALACAALMTALVAARVWGSVSLARPLQVVTSGWEQESLVALWEWMRGGQVYVDALAIPYRWSIYNWLFYHAYGVAAGWALDALALADAWLPTAARLITLTGAAVLTAAVWVSCAVLARPSAPAGRALVPAFALLVAAGPLAGFWALTARPDVWALALEAWAVVLFWSLWPRRRLAAVLGFAALAYLAWAFKQTNLAAAGAVALFLLVRREGRLLAVLTAVLGTAWIATLAIGGPAYVASVTLARDVPQWSAAHGVEVMVRSAAKSVPALAGASAVALILVRSGGVLRALAADDRLLFAALGGVTAMGLALATVGRVGSAENYFLPAAYFLSLVAMAGLASPTLDGRRRVLLAVLAGAWLVQATAVALVLAGVTGVISVRDQDRIVAANKACLDSLPRPLFIADHTLALPWLNVGTPPFVTGFAYERARAAGLPFAAGGIGGLIGGGQFAALALPPDVGTSYDGGSLELYQRREAGCPGFAVFLRRPASAGKIDGRD